jgi:hypothetical protein
LSAEWTSNSELTQIPSFRKVVLQFIERPVLGSKRLRLVPRRESKDAHCQVEAG